MVLALKKLARKPHKAGLYFTSYRFELATAQGLEKRAIKAGISMNAAVEQIVADYIVHTKTPGGVKLVKTKKASKHARDSYTKPAKKVAKKSAKKAAPRKAKVDAERALRLKAEKAKLAAELKRRAAAKKPAKASAPEASPLPNGPGPAQEAVSGS
jgi:hypothetical protein